VIELTTADLHSKFPITSFQVEYRFLSNFYQHAFHWAGLRWPTAEHAYQLAKTGPDKIKLYYIDFCKLTPGQARRNGRNLPIRPDWNDVRIGIMREIRYCKFKQPVLAKMLLATEDRLLIEGNAWGDQFWGMTRVHDSYIGANHLGTLLMEVRDAIRPRG
jgi:ribA/ribD-fused uncharacterized protein